MIEKHGLYLKALLIEYLLMAMILKHALKGTKWFIHVYTTNIHTRDCLVMHSAEMIAIFRLQLLGVVEL